MISLIPVMEKHCALLIEWASRPELEQFFRRYPPSFTWGHAELIPRLFAHHYIILEDEKEAGMICFANWDGQNKKVEMGLLIDPDKVEHKGSRVAIEACKQSFNYVFGYLGYEKIYAICLEDRDDIKHLLTKFLFKYEGTLQHNLFWKNRYHNEKCYSLISEDYRKQI